MAGTIYRGVDYSPTWASWNKNNSPQVGDSDFANDAFASLWANKYQAGPVGGPSVPVNNGTGPTNYRGDLNTIAQNQFNLVRLYDWDMARGTTSTSNTGLDHINFLNYANNLGLKVVVPVGDFFLSNGNNGDGWNSTAPDSDYSFGSATAAIQKDFIQFVASITDPATGNIHAAIQSIDVGNEGDLGQGLNGDGTTAAQFLARTNWWIYNLNKQINGQSGTGPDGLPVVANPTTVMFTATFSNAAQSAWIDDLVNGVSATQNVPATNTQYWTGTFGTEVKGLSQADASWASYYYNSVNVAQSDASFPYTSSISSVVLAPYDALAATNAAFNVPLLLMEVFTNNRGSAKGYDQSQAAVNQAADIESYLATHSSTKLIGYNYFEFTDEPSQPKFNGLYQYSPGTGPTSQTPPGGYADGPANAQTGTTSVFYGGFGNYNFPVDTLTATAGPGDTGTLISAWTGGFAATYTGTAGNDTMIGTPAAESYRGLPGNDSIDGGQGYDISLYAQNARSHALKLTAGSATITIQDKVGTDGTDTLKNIDGVRFADGALPTAWLIAAASLPATEILKVVDLYTAGLGRAPDALGLDFWASELANGAKLSDVAKAIFSSPEAAPIYSAGNSNPVFVNLAYQTALGHAADAAGLAYWTNELDAGHIVRTDFVTALIAGATGTDKQYIANREAVGAHFALTQGLNNPTWARTVESGVTATSSTVAAAHAQTDAFAAIAAAPATSEFVVQIAGIVP